MIDDRNLIARNYMRWGEGVGSGGIREGVFRTRRREIEGRRTGSRFEFRFPGEELFREEFVSGTTREIRNEE